MLFLAVAAAPRVVRASTVFTGIDAGFEADSAPHGQRLWTDALFQAPRASKTFIDFYVLSAEVNDLCGFDPGAVDSASLFASADAVTDDPAAAETAMFNRWERSSASYNAPFLRVDDAP